MMFFRPQAFFFSSKVTGRLGSLDLLEIPTGRVDCGEYEKKKHFLIANKGRGRGRAAAAASCDMISSHIISHDIICYNRISYELI